MRYSYVQPRVEPIVSDFVIRAREELASAMSRGDSAAIDQAYRHLEIAERAARMRRTTARAMRAVTAALPEKS